MGEGIALLLKPIPALAPTDCAVGPGLNARNCFVIQMIAALLACLVDCTFVQNKPVVLLQNVERVSVVFLLFLLLCAGKNKSVIRLLEHGRERVRRSM